MSSGVASRLIAASIGLLALLGPLATPAVAAREADLLGLDTRSGILGPLLGTEGPLGLLLDLAGDTLGWADQTVGSLLRLDDLVPGSTHTAAFAVRNDTDDPNPLSLRVINLHDDDNGCNAPERASGDNTCGQGEGELADTLNLKIFRDADRDGTFEASPVFSGTVQRLASGSALADVEMPAWAEWAYRVDTYLPGAVRNEAQSDQIRFDLRFELGDDNDESLVSAGNGTEPLTGALTPAPAPKPTIAPGLVDRLGGTLPVTGAGIAGILLAGWALTATGMTARLLGRRRNQQSASRPEGTDRR